MRAIFFLSVFLVFLTKRTANSMYERSLAHVHVLYTCTYHHRHRHISNEINKKNEIINQYFFVVWKLQSSSRFHHHRHRHHHHCCYRRYDRLIDWQSQSSSSSALFSSSSSSTSLLFTFEKYRVKFKFLRFFSLYIFITNTAFFHC